MFGASEWMFRQSERTLTARMKFDNQSLIVAWGAGRCQRKEAWDDGESGRSASGKLIPERVDPHP